MNIKLLETYKKNINNNRKRELTPPSPETVMAYWDVAAFAMHDAYITDAVAKTMIKNLYTERKGICFCGSKGIGKSLNMDIFAKLQGDVNGVEIEVWDAREIEMNYKTSGAGIIERLGKIGQCVINEIGTESTIFNDFGTDRNIIADLLYLRYRSFQLAGKRTFLTTNLKPETIFERYGSRIADRMREMFIFVELTGESRRK